MRVYLAVILSILVLVPAKGPAQIEASSSLAVQEYLLPRDMDLRQIRLATLPFSATIQPFDWIRFGVGGSYFKASFHSPFGEETTLNGLSNGTAQVQATFGGLVATVLSVVPSGRETLSVSDARLLGALSSDLLSFSRPGWGLGGAAGGALEYSVRGSRTEGMFGISFLNPTEILPLEGIQGRYRPGSRTQFSAVVRRSSGTASVLSLTVRMTRYGKERFDGFDLYSPGARLEGEVAYTFPLGAREAVRFQGGLMLRSGGIREGPRMTRVDWNEWEMTHPGGDVLFPGSVDSPKRRLIFLRSSTTFDRGSYTWSPNVELRVVRSGDGIGQGWIGSAGGWIQYRVLGERFGRRLSLRGFGEGALGSVMAVGGRTSIRGWNAGLALITEVGP